MKYAAVFRAYSETDSNFPASASCMDRELALPMSSMAGKSSMPEVVIASSTDRNFAIWPTLGQPAICPNASTCPAIE